VNNPHTLTGISLVLGFISAILLAFFPPEVTRYYSDGSPIDHITAESQPTKRGKRMATWGPWLSYSGPLLLALAFALQFIAWWRE
jgi:hypothetical protein